MLDINWMAREGIFDGVGRRSGSIRWSHAQTGRETSSIGYEVNIPQRWIRLRYRMIRDDEALDDMIPLTATELAWGGVRWWFVCAMEHGGRWCGRRVGKLYLPPGGSHYGCRHCHGLTYESCRESHKFDRLFNRIGDDWGLSGQHLQAILAKGRWNRNVERLRKRNEQRRRRRKARNWA